MSHWDAVIVGGGVGGLVCAGYLAVSGRRTLVLEAHDIVGGCAQAFRRCGRYEFDVGMHYVGTFGPGEVGHAILRGLGLEDRISFRALDPDGFDRIIAPGLDFAVPVGWDRYRDRLRELLPDEHAAIDATLKILQQVACDMQALDGRPARGVNPWTLRGTLSQLLAQTGLSTLGRTVLAAQVLNLGVPPGELAVTAYATMLDQFLRGPRRPVGGGQDFVAGLVEVIEAHGGEVRTRSRVERINVVDGRAVGVRLADDTSESAAVVVSNADYWQTVRDLVGPQDLPVANARLNRLESSLTVVSLYAALERDPGWPDDSNYWVLDAPDIDDCMKRLEEVPYAVVSMASNLAVPGHRAFQVMAMVKPAAATRTRTSYRRSPTYQARKSYLEERMVAMAERALGPFRSHLVLSEVATEHTHRRYLSSAHGGAYGLAAVPRQAGLLRPRYRTPVEGLYFVGSSTVAGSGIGATTIGGVLCAGEILGRSLIDEVRAGEVLAHRALPRRNADWDALAVSRGRARAQRRVPPGPLTRHQPTGAAHEAELLRTSRNLSASPVNESSA